MRRVRWIRMVGRVMRWMRKMVGWMWRGARGTRAVRGSKRIRSGGRRWMGWWMRIR
jgi:hypothetical protein